MLFETIVIFLIAFIANMQDFFGTSFIGRPLVIGVFIGLLFGDVQQGIILGATLELVFLGLMGVGATVPPDEVMGGILSMAFVMKNGYGVDAALTLALPIATLGLAIKNLLYVVVIPGMSHKADKYIEEGNITKAANVHLTASFTRIIVLAVITALSYYVGSGAIESILNVIPQPLIDGMTIATGILPAVGFAMLMGMTFSKKVAPFFFLGFVLATYLKLNMISIAIIGGIFAAVMFIIMDEINKNRQGVGSYDDF